MRLPRVTAAAASLRCVSVAASTAALNDPGPAEPDGKSRVLHWRPNMRTFCLLALAASFPALLAPASLPSNYRQTILQQRRQEAQEVNGPTGWLSLVALQPLTSSDLSVGSAPGNTLRVKHGPPHAFTLHLTPSGITVAPVDPAVTLAGKPLQPGQSLLTSEDDKATLHWGGLWAMVIHRTGDQTYLRVGDFDSPNRRHFHGLRFYPVAPAYRIPAIWTPYATPHQVRMATVLGTTLTLPSPGYAEFTLSGQTIRLDGTEAGHEAGHEQVAFSFRDGTSRTTTYGAGRQLIAERPSNGIQAPGELILDFNQATNWPCAYTEYGTCPLPPLQNRFNALLPAGEKRYHD